MSRIRLPSTLLAALFFAVAPIMAGGPPGSGTAWIELTDHGAIGDDGLDDTAAIKQALAAVPVTGGTLHVPAGDFRVESSIVIARGDIAILCDQGGRFVVDSVDVVLLSFRGTDSSEGRIKGIRVEGCAFHDPDPTAHVGIEESHGVVLNHVDRATLRDLSFDSIGDESVDIIESHDVRLLDNRVVNGCAAVSIAHVGALSVNASNNVQIRGNTIERNANGSAIRVESGSEHGSNQVIIADNLILEPRDLAAAGFSGGSGVAIVPAAGESGAIIISNNQVIDPYRYGIVIEPVQQGRGANLIVQGNLVIGGGDGLSAEDGVHRGAIDLAGQSSRGAIVGNVIDGWGSSPHRHVGIRVSRDGFTVAANSISNVPGAAFWSDGLGTGGNVVVGNSASQTKGFAVKFDDLSGLNKIHPATRDAP